MNVSAKEEVWLGRSNIIEWVVVADSVPITDLSGTTRAVICIDGIEVDSAVEGSDVIWWTDSISAKELCDGTEFTGDVIRARLGGVSTLSEGEYDDCWLTLFNPTYTAGLVVADDIFIKIHAACAT